MGRHLSVSEKWEANEDGEETQEGIYGKERWGLCLKTPARGMLGFHIVAHCGALCMELGLRRF